MSANVEDQIGESRTKLTGAKSLPSHYIDTCRICSGPAEPGEPLFHPCKCSGTIRYIHQDW